jgi:hypothetical protein
MTTRYWDLSERERSALSEDELTKLGARELMEAGVLHPGDLVLVEEPPVPEPDRTVYVITGENVAWPTHEEAEASLRNVVTLKSRYFGQDYQSVKYLATEDLAIRPVKAYSAERHDALREAIDVAAAARAENAARRSAHAKALKACADELSDMREDWMRCGRLALDVAAVERTRAEYLELLDGDEEKVGVFLAKAFDNLLIATAETWRTETASSSEPAATGGDPMK